MIQCVGSRDETHTYCSRICCAQAIKNALALKERDPGTEVTILYRDMRTMGRHELAYQQARRLGVMFIQYEQEVRVAGVSVASSELTQPATHNSQPVTRLLVTVWDGILEQEIAIYPDLVVLSAGIEAGASDDGNAALAQLLQVALDEDGFFAEAHAKLRPTDLAQPGLYVCGLAYGPRTIEETIAQARAAALRAALDVVRPTEVRRDIATVVPKLCSYCGLCVTACPYGARVLDEEERMARVIDPLCQGCGACVVACPNGASRQPALEPVQVMALVDAAFSP